MTIETITLGGGCFWCTEAVFDSVQGITDVESGYSNGHTPNPSYEQVCSGTTGHNEVVRLRYDTAQIGLREILEIFFTIHDPTSRNRQGNDVGTQYRSGIYFETAVQQTLAQDMLHQLNTEQTFGAPVCTELLALANYSPAEDYHQNYFAQHPGQGYCAAVVGPKVAKFRSTFAQHQKRD